MDIFWPLKYGKPKYSFFKKRSVMSRRKHRSAFDQVSEFDRRSIVAYRDCGLSFREIGSRVGRNQTTVMRTLNRFLACKNIPVAPQPPYSPDLSPCDFFLFPKLKNHLKGHHFGTLENIQTTVTDQLKAIPISEFHQCYEEWKKRLQRCVASEGSYFEGDNVEL
ncbi:putative transposase [Trichonephila clavipes]|nr:putative transposase [Trichonephila clavipes]